MSTSSSSTRAITNGETPTLGKLDLRLGCTHDDDRKYCALLELLDPEKVHLDSKYIKKHPKPKDQAVAQVPKSRLTKLYDPCIKRVDAWRAKHGLVPSYPLDLKAKAPTISSDQEYELADATVRRELELLTMFDGKENGNLEVTTSHSRVPEGYVPVPFLETDGGRFISVLEEREAFVPK